MFHTKIPQPIIWDVNTIPMKKNSLGPQCQDRTSTALHSSLSHSFLPSPYYLFALRTGGIWKGKLLTLCLFSFGVTMQIFTISRLLGCGVLQYLPDVLEWDILLISHNFCSVFGVLWYNSSHLCLLVATFTAELRFRYVILIMTFLLNESFHGINTHVVQTQSTVALEVQSATKNKE